MVPIPQRGGKPALECVLSLACDPADTLCSHATETIHQTKRTMTTSPSKFRADVKRGPRCAHCLVLYSYTLTREQDVAGRTESIKDKHTGRLLLNCSTLARVILDFREGHNTALTTDYACSRLFNLYKTENVVSLRQQLASMGMVCKDWAAVLRECKHADKKKELAQKVQALNRVSSYLLVENTASTHLSLPSNVTTADVSSFGLLAFSIPLYNSISYLTMTSSRRVKRPSSSRTCLNTKGP